MEFLGIELDSIKCEMHMSEDRLNDVISELRMWEKQKSGTKRKLLSILGKLVFMSRVVRPGRIFTRRLFDLASKTMFLHHHVRLSSEAYADIKWWLEFAEQWNKCSFFFDDTWIPTTHLGMYTDASGLGYGALFGRHWFSCIFSKADLQRLIAFRELYAVVAACATWGPDLSAKRLLIHCDNMAVVHCVNAGSSKCGHIMRLVRELYYIAANNSFEIRMIHVPGAVNIEADMISRDRVEAFRAYRPDCDTLPTQVVNINVRHTWL
jgi:hypothetical protein